MGKRNLLSKLDLQAGFFIAQCFHTRCTLPLRLNTYEKALQGEQYETLN